jgi:hypothetical protein
MQDVRSIKNMKIIICFFITLSAFMAFGREINVEKTKFRLSSIFKYTDGRVSDREFNVVFELKADGKVTGHYGSWLEKRLTDGTSTLSFFDEKIKGSWILNKNELQITIFAYFLPNFKFKEFNTMKIKIIRETPNLI